MGAELCLAHDMGGGGGIWGPLSVDMQPYSCFIGFMVLEGGEFFVSESIFTKLCRVRIQHPQRVLNFSQAL